MKVQPLVDHRNFYKHKQAEQVTEKLGRQPMSRLEPMRREVTGRFVGAERLFWTCLHDDTKDKEHSARDSVV